MHREHWDKIIRIYANLFSQNSHIKYLLNALYKINCAIVTQRPVPYAFDTLHRVCVIVTNGQFHMHLKLIYI